MRNTLMGKAASTDKFQYGFPTPGPQNPTGQKVMDHVFFCPTPNGKKSEKTIFMISWS